MDLSVMLVLRRSYFAQITTTPDNLKARPVRPSLASHEGKKVGWFNGFAALTLPRKAVWEGYFFRLVGKTLP
jgi:hypothetical protein